MTDMTNRETPTHTLENTASFERSDRAWRIVALNGLVFLVVLNGALALHAFREILSLREEVHRSLLRTEESYRNLDAQVSFDSDRRRLLLGIRDEILKTRPEIGASGAYELASLVLEASEKFPSVDPLLLLSIGIVDSRFDPSTESANGARGVFQIPATTGRLLARALGWEWSDEMLHDPRKNVDMAACYLDLLQTAYNDVGLVLAEYNGGPLNAGYFRAKARALSVETQEYVARVETVHMRLVKELGEPRGVRPSSLVSAAASAGE